MTLTLIKGKTVLGLCAKRGLIFSFSLSCNHIKLYITKKTTSNFTSVIFRHLKGVTFLARIMVNNDGVFLSLTKTISLSLSLPLSKDKD